MARLFTCGFEFGELVEHNGALVVGISHSVQTTVVRSGTYAWNIVVVSVNEGYSTNFTQTLAANTQELYIRIGFYYIMGTNPVSSTYQPIIALIDDAGTNQVSLAFITSTALLSIYRGGTAIMGRTGGTLLATGVNPLATNTWYVIELYIKIADSGTAIVRVNNTTDINFSGDTQASANAYVRSIIFGTTTVSNAGLGNVYFDDLAINDTAGSNENSWPGLGGTYLLLPAGDGAATTWTRSTGASNWALVDELPHNTTDYVSSSVASAIDQYTLTSLCPAVNTIYFVEPTFQAALGAAGSAGVFPLVRHSGTDYESASVIVAQATPNYVLFKGGPIYTVLGGAGAWTPAQVNALEVGMKIT